MRGRFEAQRIPAGSLIKTGNIIKQRLSLTRACQNVKILPICVGVHPQPVNLCSRFVWHSWGLWEGRASPRPWAPFLTRPFRGPVGSSRKTVDFWHDLFEDQRVPSGKLSIFHGEKRPCEERTRPTTGAGGSRAFVFSQSRVFSQ